MPGSRILKFNDPDEYTTAVGTDLKLIVTAPGKFQSELHLVNLHDVGLTQGSTSLPRIAHTAYRKNRCGITFSATDNQAPSTINGIEATEPRITFRPAGAECVVTSLPNCRFNGIYLSPEILASTSQALVGYEITTPTAPQLMRASASLVARLRNLHLAAAHLAATAPDVLAHAEVARAIEQEVLRALITCLGEASRIRQPNAKRQGLMRRFHDYIEATRFEPLYLSDVCAALDVPARTLFGACEEYLGMGPRRYLLLRRMNMARQALKKAAPAGPETVTSIATEYGFGELGRFAVRYRQLFGESPSVTLARAP